MPFTVVWSPRHMAMNTPEQSIIEMYKLGHNYQTIANVLHVGTNSISKTIKSYNNTGQIPNASKRGRPILISKEIKEFIEIKTLLEPSLSSAQLTKKIEECFHVSITHQYVSKIRNELKFNYRPWKQEQDLTPKQMQSRIEFSRKMLTQSSYLNKIAFSDESRFVLGKDNQWVWMRRGEYIEQTILKKAKFPKSVMIFGVIAY